ncbi:MAG: hypothetical protein GEU86_07720 [Actinophytocola sp.]|nr:hypothetical protein [Actinophytocola sp.]
MNEYFAELLKRPDLESMQDAYLALLERIRGRLMSDVGIEPFIPDENRPISGSACPGDLSHVDGAEVRRYRSGRSPGNISDADWPRALRVVQDVAGEEGFTETKVVVERPGDHEVAIYDRYGAEIIFGTARNTILSMSTGCHLTREGHERGRPAEKPTY